MNHIDTMKLALKALEPRPGMPNPEYESLTQCAITALREALAEQPAQQEPVADRENAIIRFALHQFMSNAYSHMNAAAQDKDNRHYTAGAVEKFAKDAKDAEALLSRLQFKAPQPARQRHISYACPQCHWSLEEQPAQRTWVGLTPEQRATIAEANNMLVDDDLFDAIESKLKEKNE